jgi:hypothetical protein
MGREHPLKPAVWAASLIAACAAVWLAADLIRAEETPDERRQRIEAKDAVEKEELRRRLDQFAALGDAEQKKLRQLHRQIENHPHSDELRDVMKRYCEWFDKLEPHERYQLRGLSPEERIKEVRKLRERQEKSNRNRETGELRWRSDMLRNALPEQVGRENEAGLIGWIDGFVARKADELLDGMPESRQREIRKDLAEDEGDRRRARIFGWIWLRWQLDQPESPPPMRKADLDGLRSQLAEAARERFDNMSPDEQRKTAGDLIRLGVLSRPGYLHHAPPSWVISDEDLRQYAKLLRDETDPRIRRLLALPPALQRVGLWWHYLRSKWDDIPRFPERPPFSRRGFSGRYGPWWMGPRRSPGGGPSSENRPSPRGPRRSSGRGEGKPSPKDGPPGSRQRPGPAPPSPPLGVAL